MTSSKGWTRDLTGHRIFRNVSQVKGSRKNAHTLAVSHGDEFWVACGTVVRYADITMMEDYIELDVPDADFEISGLVLNATRSFLVIYGECKVVAAFLPRGRQALQLTLNTQVIGKKDHLKTAISQVSMHPHCSSNTSVVILTADGFLRLFNLNLSPDEADVIVDLRPMAVDGNNVSRSVGDTEHVVPVAFCFGQGGDGWTTFTVFVLMKDGDVMAVCPLLPTNCHVPERELELFDLHTSGEPTAQNIADKIKHAIDRGSKVLSGTTFGRPAKMLRPVTIGPILFSPPPLEFTTSQYESSAIHFVATQPLNTLAIASQGKLDLCYVTQGVVPQPSSQLSVSVYETIHLDNRSLGTIFSKLSEDSADLYYVACEGLFQIDLAASSERLAESFSSEDQTITQMLAKEPQHSQIKRLLSPDASIVSVIMLEHDFETYILGIYTASAANLIRIDGLTNIEAEEDLIEQETAGDDIVPSDEARYSSLLSFPAYRAPTKQSVTSFSVPASLRGKIITADLDSLQFLSEVVSQHRKDLEELMNAFVSMYRRLALQEKEHERQQARISAIASSLKLLRMDKDDRIAEAKTRQADLERRMAKLSQSLIKTHNPQLSDAEQRYFKELARIGHLLHGRRGISTRKAAADSQYGQFQQIIKSMTTNPSAKSKGNIDSPMRLAQVSKLKEHIANNDEVLSQVKNKLERIRSMATVM